MALRLSKIIDPRFSLPLKLNFMLPYLLEKMISNRTFFPSRLVLSCFKDKKNGYE